MKLFCVIFSYFICKSFFISFIRGSRLALKRTATKLEDLDEKKGDYKLIISKHEQIIVSITLSSGGTRVSKAVLEVQYTSGIYRYTYQ